MTLRGHIKNGSIALDEPVQLPEGARVTIEVLTTSAEERRNAARERRRHFRPIEMPGDSLADELVRDRR